MAEHDLLCRGERVLIVEDEEGVCVEIDLHYAIAKHLQAVVEVDHTELSDKGVICLTQLN